MDASLGRLRGLDELLRSLRPQASESDRTFLNTLLSHPAYEKRVTQQLKVSSKPTQDGANKPLVDTALPRRPIAVAKKGNEHEQEMQ